MMLRLPKILPAAAAALVALSCTDPTGPRTPAELGDLPRQLTAAEQAVALNGNAFSFALFNRINAQLPDSNVFISPLSASMALTMAMNGAAGSTLDSMRTALGFGDRPLTEINAGYKGLIGLLRSLDPSTTFRIANSVWLNETWPVHASFVATTQEYFGATARTMPFSDPGTVDTINAWASAQTNARIPRVLDGLSDDDLAVLMNAIYFNGSWRERFDRANTAPRDFHARSGAVQRPPTMWRHGALKVAHRSTYTAAELPYGNGAFTMMIVLPHPSVDVNAVAASLTPETWSALSDAMQPSTMDLFLPKFRMKWSRGLNDDLAALGMGIALRPGADFSALSPVDAYISVVKQDTYVDVHEEGTEAAAVTTVIFTTTSVPQGFAVNRPFVFAIRERLSGTIVFLGKIVSIP